jgi:antitoxin VapB
MTLAYDKCEAIMNEHITTKKIVHVFKNGRSRAVRIPKEFEFEGDEVEMTQDYCGNITLSPMKSKGGLLAALAALAAMGPLDDEDALPDIDDSDLLPLDDVEL